MVAELPALCFHSLVIGKSWYLAPLAVLILTRVSFAAIRINFEKETSKRLYVHFNGISVPAKFQTADGPNPLLGARRRNVRALSSLQITFLSFTTKSCCSRMFPNVDDKLQIRVTYSNWRVLKTRKDKPKEFLAYEDIAAELKEQCEYQNVDGYDGLRFHTMLTAISFPGKNCTITLEVATGCIGDVRYSA